MNVDIRFCRFAPALAGVALIVAIGIVASSAFAKPAHVTYQDRRALDALVASVMQEG